MSATGLDVTAETMVHIGSITKVLKATLVMQLVDEGLVDLAAPLKRYVADLQVADRDATERIHGGDVPQPQLRYRRGVLSLRRT
jgi:CubicO group peptidase (beta-lactamase class C family)